MLLLVLASVQVVLQAQGRAFEEDFNNFHDFEHWCALSSHAGEVETGRTTAGFIGWLASLLSRCVGRPGMALIGMRVALCALFVYALHRSFRLERQKEVTIACQLGCCLHGASCPRAAAGAAISSQRLAVSRRCCLSSRGCGCSVVFGSSVSPASSRVLSCCHRAAAC